MAQSNQEENINKFNEKYEQMMKSYFRQGKLYNFWKSQLPIIIKNKIKHRDYYQEFFNQQVQQFQQYFPQYDEIIFIGEKFKLDDLYICQLQAKQLASIHFKVFQLSYIFGLVWKNYLKDKFSFKIIRKIAQFCSFDCLDLIDISDSDFKSYLSIQKNIPFIIKSNSYKFCLANVDYQQRQKHIFFEIRKLEPKVIKNITIEQLLKERIFFSGTENFEIQNNYLCNHQKEIIELNELQEINYNKAYDFLDFQQEYMNPLLITTNASSMKIIVVPNEQNDYQLSTDDDNFQKDFQKYSQILSILKFINGNWQIEHDFLFRKIEKNQRETIKKGRIITLSNKGITDHELIFDWKTQQIQFNMI